MAALSDKQHLFAAALAKGATPAAAAVAAGYRPEQARRRTAANLANPRMLGLIALLRAGVAVAQPGDAASDPGVGVAAGEAGVGAVDADDAEASGAALVAPAGKAIRKAGGAGGVKATGTDADARIDGVAGLEAGEAAGAAGEGGGADAETACAGAAIAAQDDAAARRAALTRMLDADRRLAYRKGSAAAAISATVAIARINGLLAERRPADAKPLAEMTDAELAQHLAALECEARALLGGAPRADAAQADGPDDDGAADL
ncbi:MAG: hypothetical protein R3F55_00390 [Alphaproteobacteria bacterium]